MSKSYVEHGTKVVCTNMTVTAPMELVHIHNGKTYHKKPTNALLNIEDKKISDSFVCKNKSKFWGGLANLLLGVAVGALAFVAIVGTGGTALLVVAAVAATGALAIDVGRMATKSHDCDVTKSGAWIAFHKKVFIDKNSALLSSSNMPCSMGGIITIVIDPVLAQTYATKFSTANIREITMHEMSQFLQGFVGGFTALGSAPGLFVGTSLAVYFGQKGEKESQENRKNHIETTFWDDTKGALGTEAINQSAGLAVGTAEQAGEVVTGQMVPINQQLNTQISNLGTRAAQLEAESARLATQGMTAEAAEVAQRATSTRLAETIAQRSYRMPWNASAWRGLSYGAAKAELLKGLKYGIGGAILNFGIETGANAAEDHFYDQTIKDQLLLKAANSLSTANISITSKS